MWRLSGRTSGHTSGHIRPHIRPRVRKLFRPRGGRVPAACRSQVWPRPAAWPDNCAGHLFGHTSRFSRAGTPAGHEASGLDPARLYLVAWLVARSNLPMHGWMTPALVGGTREAGKDHLDSLGGTRRHQGGRKGLIGRPARHQGFTTKAGKDHLDSLGGTRDAPQRQERTNWTACEAPGMHQGGRKGPFGQPGRHQGGTRGC